MAENNLIGGVNSIGGANYPTFQPMPQPGGMGQLNDMLSLARNAQGLQQQQFELGKNRALFVADRLGSLYTKPDLSIKDAQDMVGDMVRNQIIPASEAPEILQHFPQDPVQLRAAIKQSRASALDHINAMNLAFGAPGEQHLGDVVQPTMRDVTSGVVRPTGPNFTMGTTPGEKLAPQTVVDASGTPTQTTAAGAAAAKGFNVRTGQPLAGAFRQPGQVQGIEAPAAGFEKSVEAYHQDLAAAPAIARTIRDSSLALNLIDQLGPTDTGPITGDIARFKSALTSLGITPTDDKVAMRQELDKYLARNIVNSPLANRSDLGTLATKAAQPNTDTQTYKATHELLKSNIAQAGMDIAPPFAYDRNAPENKGSLANYNFHRGGFVQNQDQRAYAIMQGTMSPDDARALIAQIKKLPANSAERQRFESSLRNAQKAGVARLPGLTSGDNAGQ